MGKSHAGENIPQLFVTTSARLSGGSCLMSLRSLEYERTASLRRPDMTVAPGVVDRRTAWSRSSAFGAAIPASNAHIVPWLTGWLPGPVGTPDGVQLSVTLKGFVCP